MAQDYYARARTEIIPYLPERLGTLLDVGCGTGATVLAIREVRRGEPIWAGGLEFDESSALRARENLDRIWQGDIESLEFVRDIDCGSIDTILCLDVLEHLVNPWKFVQRVSPLLADGGRLIISVPNIRNWKFIWRLLAKGDFHYRDAGLLDRTHLRFFVRQTAIELATCGGLDLQHVGSTQPFKLPDVRWSLKKALPGDLDDLLVKQFIVVAEKQSRHQDA